MPSLINPKPWQKNILSIWTQTLTGGDAAGFLGAAGGFPPPGSQEGS